MPAPVSCDPRGGQCSLVAPQKAPPPPLHVPRDRPIGTSARCGTNARLFLCEYTVHRSEHSEHKNVHTRNTDVYSGEPSQLFIRAQGTRARDAQCLSPFPPLPTKQSDTQQGKGSLADPNIAALCTPNAKLFAGISRSVVARRRLGRSALVRAVALL
eukprot:gene10486-biopygen21318